MPMCHSLFYPSVTLVFQILAYDQGQPSRSATATLRVNIRDVNNKSPLFLPSTVRRDVAESKWTPLGVHVMSMRVSDVAESK